MILVITIKLFKYIIIKQFKEIYLIELLVYINLNRFLRDYRLSKRIKLDKNNLIILKF